MLVTLMFMPLLLMSVNLLILLTRRFWIGFKATLDFLLGFDMPTLIIMRIFGYGFSLLLGSASLGLGMIAFRRVAP